MRAYLLSTIWGRFFWRFIQGFAVAFAVLITISLFIFIFLAFTTVHNFLHNFLWENYKLEQSYRDWSLLGLYISICIGLLKMYAWEDVRKKLELDDEEEEDDEA